MPQYRITATVTVEAKDYKEAASILDGSLDYMFEVANGENNLIGYTIHHEA